MTKRQGVDDFSPQHQEMLRNLAGMTDDQIDYSDIPATTSEDWRGAKRMADFKPIKKAVSIRLDADVLTYFRLTAEESGYQTRINDALRDFMQRHPVKQPG